ncbi:hypothetical protein Ancab_040511 [Ancistrocladus abbreviatus]
MTPWYYPQLIKELININEKVIKLCKLVTKFNINNETRSAYLEQIQQLQEINRKVYNKLEAYICYIEIITMKLSDFCKKLFTCCIPRIHNILDYTIPKLSRDDFLYDNIDWYYSN